ncbi:hypothetical protein TNCT_468591 [Trichonephila clavata]|uniref:Uncharacterized protein n=1 Tax=Trichonephila clavata TaxID=2740835 RepID=A0A8X6FQN6_TRICU|nr:hypothetical protein TNCT_468591 [Trichonephila clavata]
MSQSKLILRSHRLPSLFCRSPQKLDFPTFLFRLSKPTGREIIAFSTRRQKKIENRDIKSDSSGHVFHRPSHCGLESPRSSGSKRMNASSCSQSGAYLHSSCCHSINLLICFSLLLSWGQGGLIYPRVHPLLIGIPNQTAMGNGVLEFDAGP